MVAAVVVGVGERESGSRESCLCVKAKLSMTNNIIGILCGNNYRML